MIGALKVLLVIPVAVVVILLSIANRGLVTLSFDPFAKGAPDLGVTLPLFAIVLGSVALGVLLGGAGSWIAGGKHRRARRRSVREVNRLEAEAERLRSTAAAARPALIDRRAYS